MKESEITDSHRYTWLLAHAGLVDKKAILWRPGIDEPFLRHLHNFITREAAKERRDWFAKQRELLDGEAPDA
jgi:hypothetical protein